MSCEIASPAKGENASFRCGEMLDPTLHPAAGDNEFLLLKVVFDKVAYDSIAELQARWINRLAGVDVWLESHLRTAILYVRRDDKAGSGQPAKSERSPETLAHYP